jgi:hypothetical protein
MFGGTGGATSLREPTERELTEREPTEPELIKCGATIRPTYN